MLARDGRVIEGVNVENAAYPLGVCAERNALSTAVTEGYRPGDFEAIAINASPCGGCRQWLYEMGFDRVVFRNRGRGRDDDAGRAAAGVVRALMRRRLWRDRHALGAVASPIRADFDARLAVGGGLGCPSGVPG